MATKLTIVTPSYNQGQFLEQTLQSVLSQRKYIHEYFVVDGGSTDNSVELIRKYQPYGIDWWVSEKDHGQTEAICKGFGRATGDVIAWLNSDEVYLPGALEKVWCAFDANPHWDTLTGYHVRIDGDGKIVALFKSPCESNSKARWGVQRVCQQTWFFKRKLYEAVGGLDQTLHFTMDGDLWYRFFDNQVEWGHVPSYLGGYRWHAAAKGAAHEERFANDRKLMAQRYPQLVHSGLKSLLGLAAFRAGHFLSGRYMSAQMDTRRYRGKLLTDVFGSWEMPSQTEATDLR